MTEEELQVILPILLEDPLHKDFADNAQAGVGTKRWNEIRLNPETVETMAEADSRMIAGLIVCSWADGMWLAATQSDGRLTERLQSTAGVQDRVPTTKTEARFLKTQRARSQTWDSLMAEDLRDFLNPAETRALFDAFAECAKTEVERDGSLKLPFGLTLRKDPNGYYVVFE